MCYPMYGSFIPVEEDRQPPICSPVAYIVRVGVLKLNMGVACSVREEGDPVGGVKPLLLNRHGSTPSILLDARP